MRWRQRFRPLRQMQRQIGQLVLDVRIKQIFADAAESARYRPQILRVVERVVPRCEIFGAHYRSLPAAAHGWGLQRRRAGVSPFWFAVTLY
jgi:hypothetical protein